MLASSSAKKVSAFQFRFPGSSRTTSIPTLVALDSDPDRLPHLRLYGPQDVRDEQELGAG